MNGENKFVLGLVTIWLIFTVTAINANATSMFSELNATKIATEVPLVFDSIIEVLNTSLYSFLIAFIFIATTVWFITVLIKGFGGDISF